MENKFQQTYVLNGLRLNRLNAGDIEEVIFVVVDEIPFHLRRRHSPERLRYINDRQVQVRKNIDGHSRDCQNRAKRNAQDDDHNTDRTP